MEALGDAALTLGYHEDDPHDSSLYFWRMLKIETNPSIPNPPWRREATRGIQFSHSGGNQTRFFNANTGDVWDIWRPWRLSANPPQKVHDLGKDHDSRTLREKGLGLDWLCASSGGGITITFGKRLGQWPRTPKLISGDCEDRYAGFSTGASMFKDDNGLPD